MIKTINSLFFAFGEWHLNEKGLLACLGNFMLSVFYCWSLYGHEKMGEWGHIAKLKIKARKEVKLPIECHVLNQGNGANIQYSSSWKAFHFRELPLIWLL